MDQYNWDVLLPLFQFVLFSLAICLHNMYKEDWYSESKLRVIDAWQLT